MNPTIDLLMKRKSVRAFTDQPVTDEEKEIILKAAMRAPTAGNMMLYTIVEVEDQKLKDRLAETCDDQPMIARAPYVLLFLADYQRWYDYYRSSGAEALCREKGEAFRRPQEGDLLLACCDALIAAQTAVVAAEALGIGSCYIGDILEEYEIHRELFGLPRYVLPVTMIVFGRPTEQQLARKQPNRFAPEYIVHKNCYRHLGPAELDAMFAEQNAYYEAVKDADKKPRNAGIDSYFRKFSAEFSIEMTRSVRVMLDSWNKS